jgi:hypothetical protein
MTFFVNSANPGMGGDLGGLGGAAMTGHHDRAGPSDAAWAVSWNAAHPTLGCSMEKIRPTGGDGLFYCFAAK